MSPDTYAVLAIKDKNIVDYFLIDKKPTAAKCIYEVYMYMKDWGLSEDYDYLIWHFNGYEYRHPKEEITKNVG